MDLVDTSAFELRASDLDALTHAESASKAALSAADNPEGWKDALALLGTSSAWLETLSVVLCDRASRLASLLNERENRNLPVSCLGPDLLRMVFDFVATSYRQSSHPQDRGRWITLGHVSQSWRDVLHGIAHLWARDLFPALIDMHGFEEKFLLARNCTLDLVPPLRTGAAAINCPDHLMPASLLSRFLPLMGRARAFEITIGSLEIWDSVCAALSSEALPHLQELSLEWKAYQVPYPEPSRRFFLADHPNLRVLKTVGYIAHPHMGNGITAVDLDLSPYKRSSLPVQREFRELLGSITKLKHLILRYWRSIGDDVPPRIVELRALQTFTMTDDSSVLSCLEFMKYLRLPGVTRAWINLTPPYDYIDRPENIVSQDALRPLLDCLEAALSGSPALTRRDNVYIKHIMIHTQRPLAKLLVRWGAIYDPNGTTDVPWPSIQPTPALSISICTDLHEAVVVAGTVSRFITATSTASGPLHLDWQESISSKLPRQTAYWTAALGSFNQSHVQSFQLRKPGKQSEIPRGSLHALVQYEIKAPSGYLLDSVRRLCFVAKYDWESLHSLLSVDKGHGQLLADFIRRRAARGNPIEALELRLTDMHKAQYRDGAVRPEEGEFLSPPQKDVVMQFAKAVGARVEFVRVEVEDTGEEGGDYPIWGTHQYTDVVLRYDVRDTSF